MAKKRFALPLTPGFLLLLFLRFFGLARKNQFSDRCSSFPASFLSLAFPRIPSLPTRIVRSRSCSPTAIDKKCGAPRAACCPWRPSSSRSCSRSFTPAVRPRDLNLNGVRSLDARLTGPRVPSPRVPAGPARGRQLPVVRVLRSRQFWPHEQLLPLRHVLQLRWYVRDRIGASTCMKYDWGGVVNCLDARLFRTFTACASNACAPTSPCPNVCTTCTGNTFATPGCAACTCTSRVKCTERTRMHGTQTESVGATAKALNCAAPPVARMLAARTQRARRAPRAPTAPTASAPVRCGRIDRIDRPGRNVDTSCVRIHA